MNTQSWPQIYTGAYWQPQVGAAATSGDVVAVGITLYPPRHYLGYPVFTNLVSLAPNRALFRVDNYSLFRPPFLHLLGERWPLIQGQLKSIVNANPHKPLVLLCFDRLDRPGDWCHRQIVAEFLAERLGLTIGEYAGGQTRVLI